MPVADPTDVTLETYQDCVDVYCATSIGTVTPAIGALLDEVIQRVPAGRVLELGSGPGIEALYLEQHGLWVERTDATPRVCGTPAAGRPSGSAARCT